MFDGFAADELQVRQRLSSVIDGAGCQTDVNQQGEERDSARTGQVDLGQRALQDLTRAFDVTLFEQQRGKWTRGLLGQRKTRKELLGLLEPTLPDA
jgi:hypothetical protein